LYLLRLNYSGKNLICILRLKKKREIFNMDLWTKGQILIFASVQERTFVLELSINK